jgi:hypothetical protein
VQAFFQPKGDWEKMTLLSRCIALFMLLTASVAWAEGRSNWVLFAPKGPGFRVELPGQPTVKNADIKTVRRRRPTSTSRARMAWKA